MNLATLLSNDINIAYKPVNKQEETELLIKAKQGDKQAQNKLVNSQLKRITAIARGYADYRNNIADLISEGTLGLVDAITMYDFEKAGNMRFHSYAQWYIRAQITYAVYDNQPLTTPRSKSKAKAEVKDANGKIIKERIEAVKHNMVSINAPVGDEDNAGTFETILPDNAIGVDKMCEFSGIMELLGNALDEREIGIFEARVFDDATYEQIAELFGMNSRQAAQLQVNKVLTKVTRLCKNRVR